MIDDGVSPHQVKLILLWLICLISLIKGKMILIVNALYPMLMMLMLKGGATFRTPSHLNQSHLLGLQLSAAPTSDLSSHMESTAIVCALAADLTYTPSTTIHHNTLDFADTVPHIDPIMAKMGSSNNLLTSDPVLQQSTHKFRFHPLIITALPLSGYFNPLHLILHGLCSTDCTLMVVGLTAPSLINKKLYYTTVD